jgi:hypothetical protein
MPVVLGSVGVLLWCRTAQAQIPVIDAANLVKNAITAAEAIILVADEALELTGWGSLALDSAYTDDLNTLGAILKDAQGLSYDLTALNAQITTLFQLNTVPNGSAALAQRLATIRNALTQSYIYALRTQTLITTTQHTIRHLQSLLRDIAALVGNKEGHQNTGQAESLLNKTLATLQAQTSAFERSESIDRLGDAVAVEGLVRIHQAIMEDYPK